jgi:hypothetical protein
MRLCSILCRCAFHLFLYSIIFSFKGEMPNSFLMSSFLSPMPLFLYFVCGPPCVLNYTDWPASHKRLDHTDLNVGSHECVCCIGLYASMDKPDNVHVYTQLKKV